LNKPQKSKLIIFITATLVVWIFIAVFFSFSFPPILDEKNFHLPTAFLFYTNSIIEAISSPDYGPVNTPLPYILLRFLTFGMEPDIHIYRIFSLIFACLTLFFICSLLTFNGIIFSYSILFQLKEKNIYFLKLCLSCFLLIFLFDTLLSERHLISLMVILFLFLHFFQIKKSQYLLWMTFMFLIGIGYTINWFIII